jgi:hypothetical protein
MEGYSNWLGPVMDTSQSRELSLEKSFGRHKCCAENRQLLKAITCRHRQPWFKVSDPLTNTPELNSPHARGTAHTGEQEIMTRAGYRESIPKLALETRFAPKEISLEARVDGGPQAASAPIRIRPRRARPALMPPGERS